MPQARVHDSAAARQAAYRQRQAQARTAQLKAKGLPPLPALSPVPGQARWNALLNQAQWALFQVCQEMEDYTAARSESWLESERGEAFQERLEAVQEVLAAVEELTAVPEKTPPKPLTEDLSCLVSQKLGSFASRCLAGGLTRWLATSAVVGRCLV